MRAVRCEVCGTKALMAASQCPKCSHLFDMRDGFGELLPLAFCPSCQSYYPAHVGSCKWCGTTPEPVRKPLPWTHISVGGLIAMAWLGGVLLRDPRGKTHARNTAQARARAPSKSAPDSVLQVIASAPADTFVRHDTIAAWTNIDAPAPTSDVPTAVPPEQSVVQSGSRASHAGRVAEQPSAEPIVSRPTVATSPSRARSRWVNLVAKNWIVVRTGASQDAHVVASVGPESRVQLGEVRGSWRRLRARDIIGWVDLRRASFGEPRGSRRVNGFASR